MTVLKNITKLHEFDFYNQQIQGMDITMQDSNYSAWLDLTVFLLKNPAEKFTIDFLQELYSDDYEDTPPVDSIITRISFDTIKETIDKILKFTRDKEVYAARSYIYWTIIRQVLDQKIPPTICYNGGSFFGDSAWNFCFIIINGNKGIVLGGGELLG